MRKIIINMHSFIDVITNSSTEIFVSTHDKTVEYAKEIIDEILRVAGSDKKADDLFEIHTEQKLYSKDYDEDDVFVKEGEKFDEEKYSTENYNGYSEGRLVITAKDNSELTINIGDKLQNMFDADGCYNG